VSRRRWMVVPLAAAMALSFAACGGGSSVNVQNPPPPPAPKLSIAFNPKPIDSLPVNGTTTLTAVVSEDSSNAGVDWSLTCQTGSNCGSIAPIHTDSGKPTTYTPPASLAGNQQTVNIVAFATADHNQNVLAPITVTAFGGALKGTYVIQTNGIYLDPNTQASLPYEFAGAIVLDGNGLVTSGEQTYTNPSKSVSDTITGGSYYVGPDGRGTLTLDTADQGIGQQGVETFAITVLSASRALVARLDNPNLSVVSNESATGTLDLQTSKAQLSAGYAFVVTGTDVLSLSPTVFGGVLNVDSPNAISGVGSIADEDVDGTLFTKASISGAVTSPDALGAVKFTLTASFAPSPIQLTGYIVDATHIGLIESDNASGTGFGATGGVALGQGSSTGTFKDASAFSGEYVFGIFGQDLGGFPASLSSAGVFTADGLGHFTDGFNDSFQTDFFILYSRAFTGSYSVDPGGTGRVNSSVKYKKKGDGPQYIFYLTGNGNPPLILDNDVNAKGGFGVGAGTAYPTSDPIAFSGEYGLSYTQSSFGSEDDASGGMTVDGVGQTLSGTVDTDSFFTPVPDTGVTGDFAATTVPRRFTGSLSNELLLFQPAAVAYYIIDSNHGLFVETDGLESGVLALGYFATRTPVCPGCP